MDQRGDCSGACLRTGVNFSKIEEFRRRRRRAIPLDARCGADVAGAGCNRTFISGLGPLRRDRCGWGTSFMLSCSY